MLEAMVDWLRRALAEVWRALRFLAPGLVSGMLSLVLLPLMLLPLAAGWAPPPWITDRERHRVTRFTGEPVRERYPVSPRRDLLWLITHALTAPIVGLVGIGLPAAAVNAVAIPFYWWALPADEPAASPFPVTDWGRALAMLGVAAGWAALTVLLVPRLARWHARLSRTLLSPPKGARLTERVAELTASRAAALEAHGAELRRIERDLHDGTQNRLVGVVMHLGIAERAMHRDPESALPLLLRAQNAASDALAELRGVVRSIYPPVLSERGLDGAVAALVARCSVPCALTVTELRRAPAAVESAAYFVVAEALTNIAKHSGAERAEVSLSTREGELLVIEVFDDGHGGASEEGGTGLLGIRRRVTAFDGRTRLVSPVGGPTMLTVELPCGS